MTTMTTTEPTTTMTDAELIQRLDVFNADMQDGLVCNFPYMWQTAKELQGQDVQGDAFLVALAFASLTRVPRYGCSVSHKQIARRASALKALMALANQVGWPRLATALGIGE